MMGSWACVALLAASVCAFSSLTNTPGAIHGAVSLDVVRNCNFQRNGPAAYLKALSKYRAVIPDHLAKFRPDAKGSVGEVPAWNQSYDREYLSPIPIGSPPQIVWLDIDTGSADLWVFTPETAAEMVTKSSSSRRIFDPSKSSTSSKVNATWYISYERTGDGSSASGNVYRDQIQLGEIAVHDVIVESATSVSSSILTDENMSGLMGLAFNHSSTVTPRQTTLLQQLSSQSGIDLFTVDLKYHNAGKYTFGAIDQSLYTGNISYQPIINGSTFWKITLTTVSVAGTFLEYVSQWPAVIDTGTTLMLLPPDLVDLYWSEVPDSRNLPSWGGWVFPCNQTGRLPDFYFGFVNDNFQATVPGRYMNYQNVTDELCYGGIQDNMGLPFAILGDTMLKSVYAVFDSANARVGFANKALDQPRDDVSAH
ncbi:Aspartic proteinase [Pleurostoma richardsiae]|uniref:Aspartic proteinase n=1 Tax=Pleurostoma richardsiae TaxID=41990 RepID=A0AA38S5Z3_9PEZI|nr:Aspartic proteinase [Pleurostoma richardsiae]